MSRRSPSKRRAGPYGRRAGRGEPLSVMLARSGPFGRERGVRQAEVAGVAGVAPGGVVVLGERPTNGGTAGSTGPWNLRDDRAEARPAARVLLSDRE